MKKTATVLLSTVCAISMAACTGGKGNVDTTTAETVKTEAATEKASVNETTVETTEAKSEKILGGWSINESVLPKDNAEAITAFEKATKDITGYGYEVIAVLGSQVVAGTNYSYLCKGLVMVPDAEAEYIIVNVCEDLNGDAKLTGSKEVLENNNGEWNYNQGDAEILKNDDVSPVFEKALDGLTGVTYDPVAYIANKDGKYIILSLATTFTQEPQKSFVLLYIDTKDDGTATIEDIKDVDIFAPEMSDNQN
jgi:hypothetical protein